jgi:phosphatidylglycerol:prolipoprotein diacylglycerol transferase
MPFLADSYLHTLNPFVIRFTSDWGIRWYGLAYAVGFLIGWRMVRWVSRRRWSPIPTQKVGDLMFAVILGVLLGGRLGYALLYEQHLFCGFSTSFPFWDLLAINKGGMASHGGMIGVILAIWLFGARNKIPILHMIDVGAMASTPGLFLGRIANFINAELWGKALPASMQANPPWWSIKYPQEIKESWRALLRPPDDMDPGKHADLVAAAAADFNIHTNAADPTQLVIEEAQRRLDALAQHFGPMFGFDERFFDRLIEIARDAHAQSHQQVVQFIKPMLTAYYPSQLIQALTDGPLLLAALTLIWLKPRKPGVVGSWFLIVYGVMRMATEVFRQPDAGVGLMFGLSRGSF